MTRSYTNAVFWKEKFVAGLPILFAQKVKDRITRKYGSASFLYFHYTYGTLISECVAECLPLCSDIKLKNQLKSQNLTDKKKIGELCDQFGFDLKAPHVVVKE